MEVTLEGGPHNGEVHEVLGRYAVCACHRDGRYEWHGLRLVWDGTPGYQERLPWR